jgi:hypothetical protein
MISAFFDVSHQCIFEPNQEKVNDIGFCQFLPRFLPENLKKSNEKDSEYIYSK